MIETLEQLEAMAGDLDKVKDRLTETDWEHLTREVHASADRIYAADPYLFLTRLSFTQDEASQENRPWPIDKPHLRDALKILESDERKIAFPKSRRRLMTWIVAGWCLWRARYHESTAVFIQSETEDKAAFVVDKRCMFLEHSLPLAFQRPFRATRTMKGSVGILQYENGSYIKAVAQGDAILRTYTPSILVMDECEFQAEGRQALVAALPFAEKRAKIVLISSSNGPVGPLADIARTIGFVRYTG